MKHTYQIKTGHDNYAAILALARYAGSRHTFAHEKYAEFLKTGRTDLQARKMVSELLGHHRDDVTRIYLAKGDGNAE